MQIQTHYRCTPFRRRFRARQVRVLWRTAPAQRLPGTTYLRLWMQAWVWRPREPRHPPRSSHWLPPPEQRVDEQGNPIEFPPCQTCGGLGHVGRIALYEMLTINDEVREVLMQTPKPAAIDAVAKRSNAKMAMASSAYRLVLLGVISLQEAQASLKK